MYTLRVVPNCIELVMDWNRLTNIPTILQYIFAINLLKYYQNIPYFVFSLFSLEMWAI